MADRIKQPTDGWAWKKGHMIATRDKPDSCELCNKQADKIVFDHDPYTNMFRGWLCNSCNLTIGLAREDVELLRTMADYIQCHAVSNP